MGFNNTIVSSSKFFNVVQFLLSLYISLRYLNSSKKKLKLFFKNLLIKLQVIQQYYVGNRYIVLNIYIICDTIACHG